MLFSKRMEDFYQVDSLLWDACKAGDKQAYASIYTSWYNRLFNYGRKFTADEQQIEDAIQEIFTRFWFQREKFKSVNELPAYLLISFPNQLIKALGKAKHT